ncbi:TonB-dependent receptor [Sphingopyxis alaskensis]|jgi:outer membrane receptor protein involved in Fe transport|uniref:TonB-dependent receptor n=1 Tax=Sphingopyxis alaskensis (strain DSM 13593 / LMG 18877 / RB2256) TaxID=317655 RepID=Q1GQN5_SPHAL|nr:TonB-dependent receptor [Sphingopyxis alaskensis]ABF54037.1 TonB-dependent receptor [Sphingopyxis alaskensis RB2256]MCM3418887.1 TonB-dependent receptor [Sphingopyxis alaskensis]
MNARASLLAGLSSLALVATPATAQDAAAEDDGNIIIVTATKRDANLQDIPFSINAQTAEDIQKSGAVTLEDLSRNVAGLSVQNLGPGQSQVSVRGVSAGQVVRDQPGVKEQVGVYLDESVISLSLFTPDIDLYDLNRVETLRGPQGTLFGSGSVGGTIRYITNQPKIGVMEGSVEANLNLVDGDDIGGHLKGAVNVPMGDNAALRAVGYYTRYGGFINAIGPAGKEDVNSGERYGGRIALTFEPSDSLSITPRIVYQKVTADGFNRQEIYNLYANQFTTTRPAVTFDEREQYLLLREAFEDETLIADLKIDVGLGGATLTSVTSYINRDILVSRDASALTGSVSVDLGFPDAGVLLPSNLLDTTDLETWTQEVRVASDNDGPFQWLVGGFYSKIDRVYAQRLPTPGYDAVTDATLGAGTSAGARNGFGPDSPYNADLPYDIKQFAIFGEISYDLNDALTATAGGRYYDFKETRSFVSGGLFANGDNRTDSTKSSGFTPRFLLSYDVSDNVTVNAQASKGFRLGGVNDPLNLPLCSPQDAALFGAFQDYDDETLWNYELGVKTQGRGFTFNAAGFYNDIKNLQVTLDAGTCSSRIVFNVPKAHSMGVEFELGLSPADGLDLNLSGSLIEAEFDSTLPGALTVATGIRDGNRLPSVPKFQLTASGSYEWPIGDRANMYVAASFQHVGTRYTQPADQENNPRTFVHNLPFGGAPAGASTTVDLQLPDYQLVNLSAGVDFDNGLSLIAYVNNVFDENALLSFDRERGGRARLGYTVGQPRTFGITARKTF